ncbi:MAG: reductive dehalogenase [Candidatus Bathyarchaeota archaeon]|nr:MAG: reductive dehalogenase [Candidatus Bathyarchaeota archaeon]
MSEGTKRAELKDAFLNGRAPFALDETTYHRFSERNVIFSRVGWDKSFSSYGQRISEREAERVGQKGYSRIGYAACSASWAVHDHLMEEFSHIRNTNPYPGSLTRITSHLPKYESRDPDLNSDIVKRLGQIFGVCDVGVAEIDPELRFVYTYDRQGRQNDLPEEMRSAIVMLVQMDYFALLASPKLPASIAVGNAYSRAAFAAFCMAAMIENLGYQAIPAVNSMGLSVPLAILAGLGEFGRNGLLIHPKYGQRVRIAKVFTDLPLTPDSPISFGAARFCRLCKKCAKSCPSQSISYGEPTWQSPWGTPSNNNGVYKWYVNVDKCYEFWVRNSTDCSNCIRACPFTKPLGRIHDIVRFFIRNLKFLNPIWIKLDDILGYGKHEDSEEFWESEMYLDDKVKR